MVEDIDPFVSEAALLQTLRLNYGYKYGYNTVAGEDLSAESKW